ncbi:MAG: hypothetical protein DYG93_04285 [Leptolyngbya sp. PLA2]|nr:hypothetical protein [Leptolyngbya sp.]MCE7970868.1 hypothetical protein [Leptolyngbya sp. PL-A2]MCQ3940317.1 hypothetical protein [cyanobacterium CYA1]MCZ7633708.1 hypothetical protein [Phycisphaerales bacterium]MDL1904613.1 hypothetical protein [Synechococcales cyanobacterium CNB]GIK17855.1 MAG: hypothetical protein BroJett004_00190 [Planctomycetota bacterium]
MAFRALIPAAALGIAGSLAPALGGDTVVVYVYNFEFSINPPGEPVEDAVIRQGDTIEWQWVHPFHNVVASSGQAEFFQSPINNAGAKFSHTFTNVGTYGYYCSVHGFDDGAGGFFGMGGYVTVLCLADFNGDTTVNTLDFLAFLNAYTSGDPRADFNGDTVINTLDVLAFLNAFTSPCP